ncbi:MAG: hypothetical protein ACJ75J_07275, partial [Cytophagaceae bacterium]
MSMAFLSCLLIYLINPVNTSDIDYMEVIARKHQRLKTVKSPRIILVGGSNVAFGIDSKKMEEELHMPVLNMGIHAGLGLTFMLNEIKPDIQKNDVIVISPEYYISEGDDELIERTIDFYPEAVSFQPQSDAERQVKKLKRYVSQVQRTILQGWNKKPDNNPIFKLSSFDDNGDMTAHLLRKSPEYLNDKTIIKKKDYDEYIVMLNYFKNYAESKGAKTYFFFPSYAQTGFHKYRNAISFYEIQMNEKLRIPILNEPETFAYPNDYF